MDLIFFFFLLGDCWQQRNATARAEAKEQRGPSALFAINFHKLINDFNAKPSAWRQTQGISWSSGNGSAPEKSQNPSSFVKERNSWSLDCHMLAPILLAHNQNSLSVQCCARVWTQLGAQLTSRIALYPSALGGSILHTCTHESVCFWLHLRPPGISPRKLRESLGKREIGGFESPCQSTECQRHRTEAEKQGLGPSQPPEPLKVPLAPANACIASPI